MRPAWVKRKIGPSWRKHMRFLRTFLLTLTVLFALPSASNGESYYNDGQKMLKFVDSCDNKKDTESDLACAYIAGYVAGVFDSRGGNEVFCFPKGVTLRQSRAILSNFIKKHPENWNKNAALFVTVALIEAFPCE
jgi:hypothetical protein